LFESYHKFIKSKAITVTAKGFDVSVTELNPLLFEFQRDIVRWALGKGKAAIFADCGDGKTAMQLEWAEQIRKRTGGKVLIVAPLAVSAQTKREGEKFGIEVNICASQEDATAESVNITNYEKLEKFVASEFVAIVLDESSIIKSFSGLFFEINPQKFSFTAKSRKACSYNDCSDQSIRF
jgi:superfamily II DNA or RNA helicase